MADTFSVSWISCLDKSMCKWMQRYTFSGFVFCPRKPWSFGNECHSIARGDLGILFFMEIVEGKDKPAHLPQEHSDLCSWLDAEMHQEPSWYWEGCSLGVRLLCAERCDRVEEKRSFCSCIQLKKYWPK